MASLKVIAEMMRSRAIISGKAERTLSGGLRVRLKLEQMQHENWTFSKEGSDVDIEAEAITFIHNVVGSAAPIEYVWHETGDLTIRYSHPVPYGTPKG